MLISYRVIIGSAIIYNIVAATISLISIIFISIANIFYIQVSYKLTHELYSAIENNTYLVSKINIWSIEIFSMSNDSKHFTKN
ncbi:hypothetical protein C1N56_06850 [Pantoea sp. SGAir0175]